MDKTKRHSILIELIEWDGDKQNMLYAQCVGSDNGGIASYDVTEKQVLQAWDEISGIMFRLSIGEYPCKN